MLEELERFTVKLGVYAGEYSSQKKGLFHLEVYVDTEGYGPANTESVTDELQAMLSKWALTWLRRPGSIQITREGRRRERERS